MLETKRFVDNYKMLVTVLAICSNINYRFTVASTTNIQLMSRTSKFCHQHPNISLLDVPIGKPIWALNGLMAHHHMIWSISKNFPSVVRIFQLHTFKLHKGLSNINLPTTRSFLKRLFSLTFHLHISLFFQDISFSSKELQIVRYVFALDYERA